MPETDWEPPRKFYELKPRAFTRLNEERGTPPPPESDTDVVRLLRENRRHEERAGRFTLKEMRRRRSRRRRDFVLAVLGVDGAIAGLYLVVPHNIVTLLFAAGGFVFATTALAWVFFVVLDDY